MKERNNEHEISLAKFYKRFTKELEEVNYDDLENGEIYVNTHGHSLRFRQDEEEGEVWFEFIQRSQIRVYLGETMETLTPKQLKLFWILTYNYDKKNNNGV